jgi:hypothetical protein
VINESLSSLFSKNLLWQGPSIANVEAVEIVKEHELGQEGSKWTTFEVRH